MTRACGISDAHARMRSGALRRLCVDTSLICRGGGLVLFAAFDPAAVEFEGTTYMLPASSSTLVRDGKVLFCTADVQGGGAVHRWSPAPGFTGWKTWSDPVIAASASALPPPSPPATPWHGSALGRVVRAAVPLEAVNFSEYDSEITVCKHLAASGCNS